MKLCGVLNKMKSERKNMNKDDVVIFNRENTANDEDERRLPSTSVAAGVLRVN